MPSPGPKQAYSAPTLMKNTRDAKHEHGEDVKQHWQPEPGDKTRELSAERWNIAVAEGIA